MTALPQPRRGNKRVRTCFPECCPLLIVGVEILGKPVGLKEAVKQFEEVL